MRIYQLSLALSLAACSAYGGLIGFYPLNGNANDASGNGRNATTVNNVSYVTGFEGQAALFNGSNSYIQVPVNIDPSAVPLVTIGAWVLPSNVNPIRAIISQDNGGFDRNINIDSRGGCASTGCYSAFTGSGVLPGTAATANPPDWTFVAATYNGATGAIALYVNGSQFTTTGKPGSGNTFTRIGSNPGFGEYFAGAIDNAFMIDQVLTASQIGAIRTGGSAAILAYGPASGVPEPATFGLAGAALAGVVLFRRRFAK